MEHADTPRAEAFLQARVVFQQLPFGVSFLLITELFVLVVVRDIIVQVLINVALIVRFVEGVHGEGTGGQTQSTKRAVFGGVSTDFKASGGCKGAVDSMVHGGG